MTSITDQQQQSQKVLFPLNPSVGMIPSLNNRHSKSDKGKMENPSNQLLCYNREKNLNWKHGKKIGDQLIPLAFCVSNVSY